MSGRIENNLHKRCSFVWHVEVVTNRYCKVKDHVFYEKVSLNKREGAGGNIDVRMHLVHHVFELVAFEAFLCSSEEV